MGFEDIARRMNERAGGKPGAPVDVAEIERKHERFQGAVAIYAGLLLTAASVAANVWLASTGWMSSAGVMLTIVGVAMTCLGVKGFVKNLRRPRKVPPVGLGTVSTMSTIAE